MRQDCVQAPITQEEEASAFWDPERTRGWLGVTQPSRTKPSAFNAPTPSPSVPTRSCQARTLTIS